ncbi:MAG: hypothetical protein AAF959_22940 [Cyanobacteria bacterium P01_D01_bin.56]
MAGESNSAAPLAPLRNALRRVKKVWESLILRAIIIQRLVFPIMKYAIVICVLSQEAVESLQKILDAISTFPTLFFTLLLDKYQNLYFKLNRPCWVLTLAQQCYLKLAFFEPARKFVYQQGDRAQQALDESFSAMSVPRPILYTCLKKHR